MIALMVAMSAATFADCVPARWSSADPASLQLLAGTPINCLLIEPASWSRAFRDEAAKAKVRLLPVIRSAEQIASVLESDWDAVVLEGEFDQAAVERLRAKTAVIELTSRRRMLAGPHREIAGTFEGVWPGVRVLEEDAAKAGPSGAPWIDTNGGFVRFVRSLLSGPIWMGHRPPANSVFPVARYLAAIADCAVSGGRWIIALDADLERRLLAREPKALRDWKRIAGAARFFENKRDWIRMEPSGMLAVVQDVESGAIFSGGVLDMIGVRHTPTRVIPSRLLEVGGLSGSKVAIDVQPATVAPKGARALREFSSSGGVVLANPPDWQFPKVQGFSMDVQKLSEDDVARLESIWKQLTEQIGRKNLGARLFNVSSMLSHLVGSEDGTRSVLFLVNYSGYQAESVTVHVPGRFGRAVLHIPEAAPIDLEPYRVEEGTGVDIEKFGVTAILELQAQE